MDLPVQESMFSTPPLPHSVMPVLGKNWNTTADTPNAPRTTLIAPSSGARDSPLREATFPSFAAIACSGVASRWKSALVRSIQPCKRNF